MTMTSGEFQQFVENSMKTLKYKIYSLYYSILEDQLIAQYKKKYPEASEEDAIYYAMNTFSK